MARSDAIREQALAFAHQAQRLLDEDDGSPKTHAQIEELTAKSERLIASTMRERAAEMEARGQRSPTPPGTIAWNPTRTPPMPGGYSRGSGRPGRPSVYGNVSWGDAVVESITKGGRFNAAVLTGGSVAVPVPLRPEPVVIGRRVNFLRELIPADDAPGGQFSYMKQTVRTNNAAAVAPGSVKPTSIYSMVKVADRTRTVAHLSEPVPRQDLSDATLLGDFVDSELRYGLDLALDAQILSGAGTGENMTGILTTAGIQVQAFATDALTTCRKAITLLQTAELVPTGFVMNPASWEKCELLASSTFAAQGNENVPSPIGAMERSLWGVPVVVSTAVAANVAILGAWDTSSILFVTQDATVDWSEASYEVATTSTDFQRNMVRFRAEGRWNIAVTRPLGFVNAALV
jgi:HK97 family phage major capsid protein